MNKEKYLLRSRALVVLGALACGGAVMAGPMPDLRIRDIIQASSLICAGRVEAIEDGGKTKLSLGGKEYEVDQKLAEIECERVQKGALSGGSRVRVEFLDSSEIMLPYQVVRAKDHALFFLVQGSHAGVFKGASPYRWVQILPGGRVAKVGQGTVTERVEEELMAAVKDGDRAVAERALESLYQLESRKMLAGPITPKSTEVQEALKGTTLALRIRKGEATALEEASRLPVFESERKSFQRWEGAILDEISHARGKAALPALHKLLRSRNPTVRQHAAMALKESGDRTSIPVLIECLGDKNQYAAMDCLSALSRITKRPGPGFDDFRKRQAEIEAEWQNWWTSEKGKTR